MFGLAWLRLRRLPRLCMYLYNNKYLFWHKASSKKTPFPGLSVMKYLYAIGVNDAEGVQAVKPAHWKADNASPEYFILPNP